MGDIGKQVTPCNSSSNHYAMIMGIALLCGCRGELPCKYKMSPTLLPGVHAATTEPSLFGMVCLFLNDVFSVGGGVNTSLRCVLIQIDSDLGPHAGFLKAFCRP